eukprot:XP_001709821.1 Hypothetical protein GL50803_98908 [Giardia lamblia ATCC 50803]
MSDNRPRDEFILRSFRPTYRAWHLAAQAADEEDGAECQSLGRFLFAHCPEKRIGQYSFLFYSGCDAT